MLTSTPPPVRVLKLQHSVRPVGRLGLGEVIRFRWSNEGGVLKIEFDPCYPKKTLPTLLFLKTWIGLHSGSKAPQFPGHESCTSVLWLTVYGVWWGQPELTETAAELAHETVEAQRCYGIVSTHHPCKNKNSDPQATILSLFPFSKENFCSLYYTIFKCQTPCFGSTGILLSSDYFGTQDQSNHPEGRNLYTSLFTGGH